MQNPRDLRAAAERYRQMARKITDQRAIDALYELAAEYEAKAAMLEAEAEKVECAACSVDFR